MDRAGFFTKAVVAAFFFSFGLTLWAGDYLLVSDDSLPESTQLWSTSTAMQIMSEGAAFDTDMNTILSTQDVREIRCLAKAMYFESKSEPKEGQLAVAHVILNRVRSEKYGDSICEVVHQRTGRVCQFSWYCSKNLKIDRSMYSEIESLAHKFYTEYESFADMTRGALYFHADYVRTTWRNLQRTVKIGRHIFYKPKSDKKKK